MTGDINKLPRAESIINNKFYTVFSNLVCCCCLCKRRSTRKHSINQSDVSHLGRAHTYIFVSTRRGSSPLPVLSDSLFFAGGCRTTAAAGRVTSRPINMLHTWDSTGRPMNVPVWMSREQGLKQIWARTRGREHVGSPR